MRARSGKIVDKEETYVEPFLIFISSIRGASLFPEISR
ncbi:hypothetical protein FFONT_0025 [Fervidicoccus fontis Kam940]|uniref:Uncharacterized protein n=1 Tax=Fervidicoccus fontis (strain DSM 19380 / JCM 18336 / VKM B-2539 / Kam940) TaxID=1163730 RepID=H9ZZ64_FERFK|nr:hypothetical protein FFONT_0025 [Fervidicoccus fontis Kam940]